MQTNINPSPSSLPPPPSPPTSSFLHHYHSGASEGGLAKRARSRNTTRTVCSRCGLDNPVVPGCSHLTCAVCHCVTPVALPIHPIPEALLRWLAPPEALYSRLDALEYLLCVAAPTPALYQAALLHAHRQPHELPDAAVALEISWLRTRLTAVFANPQNAVPSLGWHELAPQIEQAHATGDCDALCATLAATFSSLSRLNRFLLISSTSSKSTNVTTPSSTSTSGVDMPKVRLFYAALKRLPRVVLETVTESAVALLDNLSHCALGPFFDPEQLRFFMVLLENPLLQEPRYHASLLAKLCCELIVVERGLSQYLLGWFSRSFVASSFRRVVSSIQQYLTLRIYTDVDVYHDWAMISAIKVLGYFNMANNSCQLVPFSAFYNQAVNASLSVDRDFKYWIQSVSGFCFCQYPYVLNIANKNSILKQEALAQMSQEVRDAVKSVLRGVRSSPYLKLSVSRSRIVEDTLQQLQQRQHELKKQLRVHFVGEEAVDAGGVTKEFFQLIVRDIFDPKYGMFNYLEEPANVFWFNGCASILQDTTQEFRMIGTILGLAIYNGVILDLRLPAVVYKKLLGVPLCFDDIRHLDAGLHKGLQQLLDLPEGVDVEEVYAAAFEAPRTEFGRVVMHELKPGGKDLALTADNRQEYVDLYTEWLLSRSVVAEFSAFRDGFLAVCGGNALSLLKPDELELLICGNPSLDTHKLQKCAKYRTGYSEESTTVVNFWKLFHGWPLEKQKKLLFFITGSDRIPFEGVSELVLVIDRPLGFDGGVNQLPVAHACFNQLVLPDYQTFQLLDEKLSIAIENSEGFGLR